MIEAAARDETGTTALLFRCAGAAAILAGALRIASVFIPYVKDSLRLEAFYGVIDLGLLFGTMGIYLDHKDDLGIVGLAGFAILLSGIASIVGPDAPFLGADMYAIGLQIIALGSVVLSVALLRARRFVVTAVLFVGSVAAAAAGPAIGLGALAWPIAGALFGGAYLAAGLRLVRRTV